MKRLFTINILAILLLVSACGMGRPLPPTIVNQWGGMFYPWSGGSNGTYATTTDPFLNDITLSWDVSNINGASGVEIIIATDPSCEVDIIDIQPVFQVTINNSTNNYYYLNTLNTLFNNHYFSDGMYYICLKVVKYNQSKSPASWPAYLKVDSLYY